MRSRLARVSVAVLALSLFAAACADDDEDATTTTTTEAMETTTTAGDDAGDEEGDDIVDTAIAAGNFDTLVAAVQAAGLEETLRGEGPFTVFAPTDEAFDALPEGTVEALLEDPEGDLTSILTYHVVEGAVLAEDVVGLDGEEVTTINGATFTVNVTDGGVTLTDASGQVVNVTQTDIETSNGVIHVIDAVLMPS
jgi:uncharacterized surface protein with fasciclin (FAS1) repeats